MKNKKPYYNLEKIVFNTLVRLFKDYKNRVKDTYYDIHHLNDGSLLEAFVPLKFTYESEHQGKTLYNSVFTLDIFHNGNPKRVYLKTTYDEQEDTWLALRLCEEKYQTFRIYLPYLEYENFDNEIMFWDAEQKLRESIEDALRGMYRKWLNDQRQPSDAFFNPNDSQVLKHFLPLISSSKFEKDMFDVFSLIVKDCQYYIKTFPNLKDFEICQEALASQYFYNDLNKIYIPNQK